MIEHFRLAAKVGVLTLMLVTSSTNVSFAWSNSEGEEDWGVTCFLEQEHDAGQVAILTGKDGFSPSMLFSNGRLPKTAEDFSVVFTLEDGRSFKRPATINDYYGQIDVSLNRRDFDRLAAAHSLTLSFNDQSMSVPMNDASAFADFLKCAGE